MSLLLLKRLLCLSSCKKIQHLPCELWLSLAEERVTRAERRDVPSLSELSVCSGSVEKSESSVPSELLPAFLCNTADPTLAQEHLNLLTVFIP